MNLDWEIQARREGADYFDEDYEALANKNKYKHEQYLNTGFWWFRNNNKNVIVFTSRIASTEYLFDVITKETKATVYYNDISSYLGIDELQEYYKNSQVTFVKIDFVPHEAVPYITSKNKRIPYSTIVLAGDDTIIFDKKELGAKKDKNGDKRVYRIKDKMIFQSINSQFNNLLHK